jgi:hypothetical protein
MKCSSQQIRKFYGNHIIYTDKQSYQFLSRFIDSDFEIVHDEVFKKYSSHFWILPKIATYKLQRSPFVHIDLDFIPLQSLSERKLRADILCQGYEDVSEDIASNKAYTLYRHKDKFILPSYMSRYDIGKFPSVNVGLLYMQDLGFRDLYVNEVEKFIDRNHQAIVECDIEMCVIEQHILSFLIRERNMRVETLIPMRWDLAIDNPWFIHFVGYTYKGNHYPQMKDIRNEIIGPYIDQNIREISRELCELKGNYALRSNMEL